MIATQEHTLPLNLSDARALTTVLRRREICGSVHEAPLDEKPSYSHTITLAKSDTPHERADARKRALTTPSVYVAHSIYHLQV